MVFIAGCSGGSSGEDSAPISSPTPGGTPTPTPTPPQTSTSVTMLNSREEAARFLATMSYGASIEEIDAAVGRDAADLLAAEFSKSPTLILPTVQAFIEAEGTDRSRGAAAAFHNSVVTGDDQLRQRMVFALSQIFVVSSNVSNSSTGMAYYVDRLSENAFGTYRELIEDITYTPNMGEFLTYLRNLPGDPETGRVPDENYAREILQLFSIGLFELNNDGTPVLGGDGEPIELYTNEDISGLARVFTGFGGVTNLFDIDRAQPMNIFDRNHSQLEKSFLGLTIPEGTNGDESVSLALDHISNHDNVGPFIARQLIQRFTESNPPPEYVGRVATAFNTGIYVADNGRQFGSSQRGNFEATLAAILLEPDLFNGNARSNDERGKVREPLLHLIHWARAFDVEVDALRPGEAGFPGRSFITQSDNGRFSQAFFRSPSVFNFYRPGYVAPGTLSGENNLTVPELQIYNEGSFIPAMNYMTSYVTQSLFNRDYQNYLADYSDEIELADQPEALVDRLDLLLTAGRLPDDVKAEIAEIISLVEISDATDAETENEARLTRVEAAILAIIARPEFVVWN